MTFPIENKAGVATIAVSLIGGLFVYAILSYLLVAQRISIPVAVAMFMLILGLTRYYSTSYDDNYHTRSEDFDTSLKIKSYSDQCNVNKFLFFILFATLYAIILAICVSVSKSDSSIFVSWNDISGSNIIQLAAAITLSFFAPGFAIVLIITKKTTINPLLKVLLGYLFSILITGLTAYVSAALFDIVLSESRSLFVVIYLVILVAFAICYPINEINLKSTFKNGYHLKPLINMKFWVLVKSKISELLVFGSLFMLLIIYTYYIFGAVTIGDQWFHQGRALLFMSGTFKEVALSGADGSYPPFQSALIAAITTLSGVPLVNTYASIGFLNITVVLAFYYFFSRWAAPNMKRAALFACSLFSTSSGFGWIYLLSLTISTSRIISQNSLLDTFDKTRPLDVLLPTNFVIAAHPEFSTGLIYIALPAGFILLGLLRQRFNGNFTSVAIVTVISILGILAHPEFYLFIIIACVLPIIFKMKEINFAYLGFIFAILVVYVLDLVLPGKYYTAIEILGFPLLALSILFVGITWGLYSIRLKLVKGLMPKLDFFHELRTKLFKQKIRVRFLTSVVVISVVAYMYILCFIIWAQLSTDEIKIHAAGYNVPFYLYPMKLGLTGILGLAFILSYLFKKYDRHLFVFGIIIVIAFVAGPFYDEHRFSKYIMVGMIGFASLLVYKILNFLNFHNKPILNRILVGIIIVSTSLSTLLFIGYNSLILQTQDYTQTLGRRNFPQLGELHLFDFLRDKVNLYEKKYNIVTFPDEYDPREGVLVTKLQAFSGLPDEKLYQSHLTLNASTLDAFYRLLNYSDSRFIIIPKDSVKEESAITGPTHFALDYFHRIYEDDTYIVLEVPDLTPPSSDPAAEVALVFDDRNKPLPTTLDTKILRFNNETLDFPENPDMINIKVHNKTGTAIISAYKGSNGLWSKKINVGSNVNYIELPIQILADRSDPAGLKWIQGDKAYYVFLSEKGLELSEKAIKNENDTRILSQNTEIEKKDLIWYKLKVEVLQKSINVFVDDLLKISVPRANLEGISQVGISYFKNTVEFGPLKIGRLTTSAQKLSSEITNYDDYYYPLSALALSRTSYDVFTNTDLSAFSKDAIILVSDPLNWDDTTFKRYLEYANAGGKIIVISSDNNLNGRFSQLFSLHSNNNVTQTFTKIMGHDSQHAQLDVSGLVKRVDMESAADKNIIASYVDHTNHTVAPFAIEKYFSNGGRIVLVNAEGYFNAVSKSPRDFFSLSKFPSLFDLNPTKDITSAKEIKYESTAAPMKLFVGNVKISGNITLDSSSFLMGSETNASNSFYAKRVSISGSNNLHSTFNNVQVRQLILTGEYNIIINSTGPMVLPRMGSQHNYFSIPIPAGFNMSVMLFPRRVSSAEIVVNNNSAINVIKVNEASTIKFYEIGVDSSLDKPVSVLLKRPQIMINGNTSFGFRYSKSVVPFDIIGHLKAKLDFVDHYIQHLRPGPTTQFMTYLQSLTIDGRIAQNEMNLNLPGDISSRAKALNLAIPIINVLLSRSNIILLLSLAAVTLCGSWLMWAKVKKFNA